MRASAIAVEHLANAGRLLPVTVSGWNKPVYRHIEAKLPRTATGRALLSPFDSLVFERRRLEALFGFHYRLEIYTPKGRREFGFYTMPVLHGDRLIGRVDPRMDRSRGVLEVLAVHLEPGVRATAEIRKAVGSALRDLGRFLGAREVSGGPAVPTAWRRAI